jgi:rare lipoprotein A (peptidoglycan hydrolase)
MLTLVVTSTPATGVLAALPQPTDPLLTGATVFGVDAESEPAPTADPTPTPTIEPTPAATTDPDQTPAPTDPAATAEPSPPAAPTPTPTPTPAPTATPGAAAAAAVVTPPTQPRPRVVAASRRPASLWAQLRSGLTVRGVASWYGATRGYAGIAHVAMPGARYLASGRAVPRARVCVGDRCTVVRIVDACGCHARTPRARVADLSWTTLRRLGLDPRRGVYRVHVTLIRG